MSKRVLLLLAFSFFYFHFSFAQIDSFKIKDYKFFDFNRQQLSVGLDLLGANHSNSASSLSPSEKRSNLSLNGSALHRIISNSRSLQKESNLLLRINDNYLYSNNSDAPSPEEENRFIANLEYDIGFRKYYRPKRFWGLVVENENYYSSSFFKSNNITSKNTSFSSDLSARFAFGTGRIERVEDAMHAVYILDRLKENGVLLKEPSSSEITSFAEAITYVKNRRVLDARMKRIFEITELDKHLVSSELVNAENGSTYFTTLYDEWQFSFIPERLSGNRITYEVGPTLRFRTTDLQFEDRSYQYGGLASVKWDWHKPISLKWQRNFTNRLDYEFYRSESSIANRVTENTHDLRLTSDFSLGYYLNSRTFFEGGLQGSYKYSFDDVVDLGKNYRENWELGAYFGFNYWLSPTVSYDARLFYRFNRLSRDELFQDEYKVDRNNSLLQIGVTYHFY